MNNLKIIAHRGSSGTYPENTALAFQKAIYAGADMIETDARVCKTGEVVLHHDHFILKNNKYYFISELSVLELKKLKPDILTLNEALEIIKNKIRLNIEIKEKQALLPALKTLKDKKVNDVIISSFIHEVLLEAEKLAPDAEKMAIFACNPLTFNFLDNLPIVGVVSELFWINEQFVKKINAKGLSVFVWTVNTKKDYKRMQEIGVEGVFTDYPEKFKTIVENHS